MIKVEHQGKVYSLTKVGGTPTWVDNRNIIASVELQNHLRKQALEEGVDQSVFLVKKTAVNKGPKVKRARKKKDSLGVKLF